MTGRPTRGITVLSVVSEVFPLVKTGGLADVAGALPGALAREGVRVVTLVPGYPGLMGKLDRAEPVGHLPDLFGGEARLLDARAAGLDLLVLDAPHLYARAGSPYADEAGQDFGDNAQRFAALALAAARIGQGALSGFVPDVIHAHDWQAALVPAYLHYAGGPRPGTVMTIHNMAFQGAYPAYLVGELGFPASAFSIDGIEYHGHVGYLKAGLQFADRITTVSPTYALEIRTPEGGMGLDGLLRARSERVRGILNGIDTEVWNPARDTTLPEPYDADRPGGRAAAKAALQRRLDLDEDPGRLLFGVVSRLSWQKGLDLLLDAVPHLLRHGAQLALLGAGERDLEYGWRAAAASHPGRIGAFFGYDEGLAHLVQAGCDALLVPSRFEPCGLTQLCALRYGAVPVVARVGGLADTIIDANAAALAAGVATGIQFAPTNGVMLAAALDRAAALYPNREAWRRLQANGMRTPVGWEGPARAYAALYREIAPGGAQ